MSSRPFKKAYWRISSLVPISLEKEFEPYRALCRGLVLNVGAGSRPLDLGTAQLKTDVDPSFPIDFLSDAHAIPLADESVDAIVHIAVLEHLRRPWRALEECRRVLRPGGRLIIAVPFLQPEHNMPHDYFRFTVNGMRSMLQDLGFEIERQDKLVNSGRVMAWLMFERTKRMWLRRLTNPLLHLLSRAGRDAGPQNSAIYRGAYTIARKPGEYVERPARTTEEWMRELLRDPASGQPLVWAEGVIRTADGAREYPITNGKPNFIPEMFEELSALQH